MSTVDCIVTINEYIFVISFDFTEDCVTCTQWFLALNKGTDIIYVILAQADSKPEV